MIDRIKKLLPSGRRVKVPTVLQMESVECGAACLAMILAHYGQWVPLEKLRQECGVNRDGVKAGNINRAARKRNCTAEGFRYKAEQLLDKQYPLIIHWEFAHFVVLEGIWNGVAYLNDPAMGRRRVPWEEFRTSYTGITIEIRPTDKFKPEGHRYNIVKALAEKLSTAKLAVMFVVVLDLCMIVPGLATPVFNQIFLDDILSLKHADWAFNFMLAMAVAVALTGAMNALRTFVLTRWQRKLMLVDSSKYFWHLLRLPMSFFNQRYAAEVAGRVQFNDAVAEVLSRPAASALLDMIVALFFLMLLLQYSVALTLIGVAMSALNALIFFVLRRNLIDLNLKMQQDQGKEYGVAANGLRMIETIKANGSESELFTMWAGYRAKVLTTEQEIQIKSLALALGPVLTAGVNSTLIMTVGGFSIMEGAMTAGMFMAFQSLMAQFQEPMTKLMTLGSTLQTTAMQMQRLNDVMQYHIDEQNYPSDESARSFERDRLTGELELEDVSFGYSPIAPPLIEHFNLHIAPGNWAAVVGASGSGKSTLAKIVTGMYAEWSGRLLLDGVERKQLPREVVVNSVAAVDQDIFLITGTIAENIALFDESIKRSDIIQAAKDACIHDDILRLDGGYDAKVNEGGLNFSGGQRQRLEIARALANNPSLLILDEATSALDPMTEQEVIENIRHRGCACLVVAHRLSTIRDCDEIIVLERGKVMERGTHREMIQHDGAYRRLIEERGSA
ncbi:MAG: NHLP family bacteriocin export ABC transporter peptidase/permease/ATPase subunit [Selenomonadaceae bacterium]|nr:NHLP family bacteriocin export ABC transporter peptidase/permease/ATPase subunit [Selenomonadaceae bacterium]